MAQPDDEPATINSYIFTLDDMCIDQDDGQSADVLSGTLVYKSGSRQDVPTGDQREGMVYIRQTNKASGSYRTILDLGADRFTTVMHGGYDGLDITEAEPFKNEQWLAGVTEKSNYAFNSVKVAVDSLRDPEFVEFDLAAMPGITITLK